MKVKPLIKAIRMSFRDVAFLYRMGSGFAGDVNRTHPAAIEPALVNVTTPPLIYGQALIATATNDVRPYAAADAAVAVPWGLLVRPYPTQQTSGGMAAALGAAVPPVSGVVDVCRSGMIMAQLNIGSIAPQKGGAVFVWCAVTSGNHIQGGFESAASGGNTAALDPTLMQFNGPADANGIVEISVNLGA